MEVESNEEKKREKKLLRYKLENGTKINKGREFISKKKKNQSPPSAHNVSITKLTQHYNNNFRKFCLLICFVLASSSLCASSCLIYCIEILYIIFICICMVLLWFALLWFGQRFSWCSFIINITMVACLSVHFSHFSHFLQVLALVYIYLSLGKENMFRYIFIFLLNYLCRCQTVLYLLNNGVL